MPRRTRKPLQDSKSVIHVLNWPIATNDDDRPVEGLGRWVPLCDWTLDLLSKESCDVDPPPSFIADDLVPALVGGEPYPAPRAIGSDKPDRVGLVPLSPYTCA